MCRNLTQLGISCTAILDSAMGYVMEKVDMVMVGAEGVAESGGVINKVYNHLTWKFLWSKSSFSNFYTDRHLYNGYMCERDEETILRVDRKFQIFENLSFESGGPTQWIQGKLEKIHIAFLVHIVFQMESMRDNIRDSMYLNKKYNAISCFSTHPVL